MINAVSIKCYQNKKNGRDEFLALVAKYIGEDKWQILLKDSDDILKN